MQVDSGSGGESDGQERETARPRDLPVQITDSSELPTDGVPLQVAGFWTAFGGAFPLGLGFLEAEPFLVLVGGLLWVAAGGLFGWGGVLRSHRKRAIRELEERNVVRAAVTASGVLTTTSLAAELGISITAAEALLLRMEDGLRVTSSVRRDGTLVFEFPEIPGSRPTLPTGDGETGRH